jgi:tetratricopeptide (TPR) repeat protein
LYEADINSLGSSAKANSVYADEILKLVNADLAKSNNLEKNMPQIELALEHYKKTIEIYPEFPSAYNNIGIIYFNFLQKFDLAVIYFKKDLELDSIRKETLFNLAYSYEKTGDTANALSFYKRAYKLDTTNIDLMSCWANLLNKTGKLDSAIKLNLKMTIVNPATDRPYINIGNYYCKRCDTATAVKYWEKAILIVPDNFKLNSFLYKYFQRKGDTKKYLYYYGKTAGTTVGNP